MGTRARALICLGAWVGLASCGDVAQESPYAPYALCDGSDDVRLAVVLYGGGDNEQTFEFTNPYGHDFLFVNGKCEYLIGRSLMQPVMAGTLSAKQASEIEEDLALHHLPAWSSHDDYACPDAPVFYLRSATGYGECSCGCDGDAPSGLESALNAASAWTEELIARGSPLDGPVEVIAISYDHEVRGPYQEWTLDEPLESFALPEAELYVVDGTQPTVVTLTGEQATAARALRAILFEERGWAAPVPVQTDDNHSFEVFIRDQVPAVWADAIETFGQPRGH